MRRGLIPEHSFARFKTDYMLTPTSVIALVSILLFGWLLDQGYTGRALWLIAGKTTQRHKDEPCPEAQVAERCSRASMSLSRSLSFSEEFQRGEESTVQHPRDSSFE